MLVLLSLYVWRSFNHKEDLSVEQGEIGPFTNKGIAYQLGLVLAGLIGLIGGAKLLVSGGVSIARMIGISEWFIGITIVAIGTSLPEIVSSIIAARRGQSEMAIGCPQSRPWRHTGPNGDRPFARRVWRGNKNCQPCYGWHKSLSLYYTLGLANQYR